MRPTSVASSRRFSLSLPRWASRAVVRVLLVAPLAAASALPPSLAVAQTAPQADDAKARLQAGDKAAKAKDWESAAREYAAAVQAQKSAPALLGLANAAYQLKRWGEAYDAYDDLLKTFGPTLRGRDRYAANARLKELGPKTGALALRIPEPGATVSIDGREVGKTPVAAQIRVMPGTHKVVVTKDGFAPAERTVDVAAGGKAVEDITLAPESRNGRLAVTEKGGQTLRVLVDGVDVGATPFEGEVEAGARQVEGKSTTAIAPAQSVEVARGKLTRVELVATTMFARLEVRTSDNKGLILLDGKPVAEGAYASEVPVGRHVLTVKREGFVPYEKALDLADKQTAVETVTLVREGGAVAEVKPSEARTLDGLYGGLRLAGAFVTSGHKSSVETNCSGLGATSCSTPTPVGGGLSGYIGYAYYPFGLELLFGGGADFAQPVARFDGQTAPAENPLVARPARDEQFTIARGGGYGALRARFSYDVSFVRLSAAAGVGFAARYAHLARTTNATDGSGLQNVYNGGGKTYFSPAASVDGSVQLKVSKTFAIALGFDLWAEDAGSNVVTAGSNSEVLVSSSGGLPQPLATPPYDVVRGAQVYVGPYLGFQFGP